MGSRVILIVEDEDLPRLEAAATLEGAGFIALEASDAEGALFILQERGSEIGVMFADLSLPGTMDGMALAREVHERWPHITPVLTSGRVRLPDEKVPDGGTFVPKPWSRNRLIGAIEAGAAQSL